MADSGGLEWLLALNAKLDEVRGMTKELQMVTSALRKTDEVMRKTERQSGVLGRMLGRAGGAFASFGKATLAHMTALASFEGLKRLAGGLINIGQEAMRAAGEAQRTRASFRLLLGEKPADDLLAWIDKVAKHTEFTDGPLKNFAAELSKAGFAGEDLKDGMAAVLDLAARTPDKMAGAADAVALLSRARLTGIVDKNALRNAGFNTKEFYGRLAKDLGVGIATVKKRLAAGKVDTTVLLQALYKEITEKTKKPLGGAGVAMSGTFLAQLEKVKDIVPNLFEELEQTGGLQNVTAGLKRVTELLAPDSPAGRRIIGGLENLITRFGQLVSNVDFEAWAGRIETALDTLGFAVEVAGAVGGALGKAYEFLTGFSAEVGGVLYDILEFDLAGAINDFILAGIKMGKALWQGLKQGIVNYVDDAVAPAKFLGGQVIKGIKSVLDINSPSGVFENIGMMTAAGFTAGIAGSVPGVQRAMAAAFSPMSLLPAVAAPVQMASLAGATLGRAAASPGGGAAGPHLEANVTVNVSGAGLGPDVGRQVGEASKMGAIEALESILAQLAAQGGGS